MTQNDKMKNVIGQIFCDFIDKVMLLCHDNIITLSLPTKSHCEALLKEQ